MYAIHPTKNTNSKVNIIERVGNYDISVCFDDSCGQMDHCYRSDIRVFRTIIGDDVTERVFNKNTTEATIRNLHTAYIWCLENSL